MRNPPAAAGRAIAVIAFVLAVCACSFDYGDVKLEDNLSEETPNSILLNFQHTVVENGKILFRLNALKASIYDTLKETRLTNVSFAEYDPETGAAVTSGRATSAIFFSESENAELSGDISFYSKRNEAGLEGGYLYWDNSKKTLEGRRDRLISILKDDGSIVKGEGFSANAKKRTFSFSGRTSGVLITKDDEGAEKK
jgi:LPS export ABC transporter protein LptC